VIYLVLAMIGLLIALAYVQWRDLESLRRAVTEELRIAGIADRTASREIAALHRLRDLQQDQLDSLRDAMDAQVRLSILHAEQMTRLQSRIEELKRRPFFTPARGDN